MTMLSVVVYPARSGFVLLPLQDERCLFVGFLLLKKTPRGPRPARFRILQQGAERLLKPSDSVVLLRRAGEILLAGEGENSSFEEFQEFLSGFQLEARRVNACGLCLRQHRFTPLQDAVRFHGRYVCRECAEQELLSTIRDSNKPLGISAQRRLQRLLRKTRDFDEVAGLLSPLEGDFNLTRVDVVSTGSTPPQVEVDSLHLVPEFKALLLSEGVRSLLPVQSLSVKQGLLEGADLLVVSATATGKTFVGELAGVENILRQRGKLLFLVPLVALANQKYHQFSKRYASLGISVSLRVGVSRIKGRGVQGIRTSLNSDIIVGTYEGVDYVIRSGMKSELGRVGTVVIDEVHMLEDAERGPRIDGLIARLRFLFPDAQFIYLSATVGNPRWLAEVLGARLVEYEQRPVPLERHLVFASEAEKLQLIERLCREEHSCVLSKGFRGQSIVFTNSRRRCQEIARRLKIEAAAYHAGMSYRERVRVEQRFAQGRLPVVVTTAALAAGVDFPASQVIFETLSMGIEPLSVQEFQQMQGRAGRPDYHDRGRVVLLADANRRFQRGESEDELAFRLLGGRSEHVDVVYDTGAALEQTLSNVAASGRERDITRMDELLLGYAEREKSLRTLLSAGFLRKTKKGFTLTQFGRVVCSHFLSVEQAFLIKEAVLSGRDVLDIVVELTVFDAVYFRHAGRLSRILKVEVPERVFTGAALDMVFSSESIARLDHDLQDMVLDFSMEFLSCQCTDSPFCGCGEKRFSKYLLELRSQGLDPQHIIEEISKRFGVYAYSGDLINYLEDALRVTISTALIAEIFDQGDISQQARMIQKSIEEGKRMMPGETRGA